MIRSLLWSVAVVEVVFLAGVLGQAAIAALARLRVEVISFGFGPPLLRGRRFQLAAFPLGGFVRVAGLHATTEPVPDDDPRAFFRRPLPVRLLVVLGWPVGAQVVVMLFVAVSALVLGLPGPMTLAVGTVRPDGPADRAGVRAGDEIVNVDGDPTRWPVDVTDRMNRSGGRPVTFGLRRQGRLLNLSLAGEPAADGRTLIGITIEPRPSLVRPSIPEALLDGVRAPFRSQARILDGFAELIGHRAEAEVVGPIGMGSAIADLQGPAERAQTLALFGAAFVLLSLLPIPPLPGGQILLVLLGWRSRRPRGLAATRDAGEVPRARVRFPVALAAPLLVLGAAAVTAVLAGEPEHIVSAIVWLLLGATLAAGAPRAWAWGVYLPLLNLPQTLAAAAELGAVGIAVAAALLVVPATLLLPPVRRYFQRACHVCGKLAAHPVRSAPRMCCMACGSTYRLTRPS